MLRWIFSFLLITTQVVADPVSKTILVDGKDRRYLVADEGVNGGPSLIVLHGGGGKPEWAHYRSGDFGLSGWRVIYPAASGSRRWNDGRRAPDGDELSDAQDAAFLNSLLDKLVHEGADPHRIFIAGDSNGGMMTLRMICEAGGRFAGAAVLIGNQPVGLNCPYTAAVPLIFFHGTADSVTPFEGGPVAKSGERLGHILSVDETLGLAVQRNKCDGYQEWLQNDPFPNDLTSVRVRIYDGCQRALHHYIIDGGGHSWPGHPHKDAKIEARFGPTTQDIDADDLIAAFFMKTAER